MWEWVAKPKIIHSVVATAANFADSTALPDLLHGEETRVWGDQPSPIANKPKPSRRWHLMRRTTP
jgi:IS5 family transposase